MILVICLMVVVSSQTSDSFHTVVKKSTEISDRVSQKSNHIEFLHNNYLESSTSSVEQSKEDVPNFLPTEFHDFVSSDQGPTYSYGTTSNTPKFYEYQQRNFNPENPYEGDWNSMYGFYLVPNLYSIPGDRYRTSKPPRLYSMDVNDYKHPIPENRLPKLGSSRSFPKNNDVHDEELNLKDEINVAKSRKIRSNRNFLENKSKSFFSQPGSDNRDDTIAYYRPPSREMSMFMDSMKDMVDRNEQWITPMDDSSSDNSLSDFLKDPLIILVMGLLPLSMMLLACLPVLAGMVMSNGNIPLVTTVATGNRSDGKMSSLEFLSPIMGAIGTFSPRSDENGCILKTFCRNLKKEEPASVPLQRAIFEASTYVDGFWLNAFGLKSLIESLKDGECGTIQCSRALNFSDMLISKPPDKGSSDN